MEEYKRQEVNEAAFIRKGMEHCFTPLKADGTPDMGFNANKSPVKSATPTPKSPKAQNVEMGLVDSFNKIDMTKVLKGAAAMVVLCLHYLSQPKHFKNFQQHGIFVGKGYCNGSNDFGTSCNV